MGLPNVTMVLSGMSNLEQMEDNVKTAHLDTVMYIDIVMNIQLKITYKEEY